MNLLINQYSFNRENEPILDQIAIHLRGLSCEQQAALAVAALYEGYEPCAVAFDYSCCPSRQLEECVTLLQHLSLPGKLALVRAITEYLAVLAVTS